MKLALDRKLDAGTRTLYVKRPLLNAADLIAWAKGAGFKKTLPASDMHVTIAFSKTPVDWSNLTPDDEDAHLDSGGPRSIAKLGDQGAVVLKFKMTELDARWEQFKSNGASWDYPSYKPHVTITYDVGDLDISAIDPYDGPLDFGPEVFAEVDSGWADKVKSNLAATDSALRLALDRDSVRSFRRDGQLKVARANITKANICPYRGEEIPGWEELGLDQNRIYQLLRDPDELAKGAETSNGVQLLQKHEPVSAEDHKPYDTVGSLGTDAEFDGTYVTNSLFVNAKSAIAGIESEEKRELSAGYHYRPDMTPGNFRGSRYDGVMRDIVFNHVALVEDGRAGDDVVVGDSTENLHMKSTRLGALVLGITAAHIAPMLAMDGALTLPKDLFGGFKVSTFKDQKAKLLSGVKLAVDGKLRKGIAFDENGLAKLLDALEGSAGVAGDEPIEPKAEKEVEELAAVKPMPAEPVAEKVEKKPGAFDAEAVKAFCRGKGATDEEMAAMFPEAANDADPEAEKKRLEEEEAKKKQAADAEKDKMKDMVSKPAMDAALKAHGETIAKQVRETERGIRLALDEIKPWVGELPVSATMALDSREAVHRKALTMMNVQGADKLHADALLPVLQAQPKPGARAAEHRGAPLALDSAQVNDFTTRFPGSERIGTA